MLEIEVLARSCSLIKKQNQKHDINHTAPIQHFNKANLHVEAMKLSAASHWKNASFSALVTSFSTQESSL